MVGVWQSYGEYDPHPVFGVVYQMWRSTVERPAYHLAIPYAYHAFVILIYFLRAFICTLHAKVSGRPIFRHTVYLNILKY